MKSYLCTECGDELDPKECDLCYPCRQALAREDIAEAVLYEKGGPLDPFRGIFGPDVDW